VGQLHISVRARRAMGTAEVAVAAFAVGEVRGGDTHQEGGCYCQHCLHLSIWRYSHPDWLSALAAVWQLLQGSQISPVMYARRQAKFRSFLNQSGLPIYWPISRSSGRPSNFLMRVVLRRSGTAVRGSAGMLEALLVRRLSSLQLISTSR
jgi:hypothetical protein